MEHLISLGHGRIAFVANDTDDGDHIDRLEAYRHTLTNHHIYDAQLEFRVPAHRLDGAQLMRKMMSINTPPSAVFIADPLTACGAINEARKLGLRIPEEMSILGFDDSDSRFSVEPTMTAICQNSRELGRLAYDMLVERCEGLDGAPQGGLGKAWLEINHTTARAPSQLVRIMPNGERLPVAAAIR
jgi:LacI family transcriptional regulator